MSASKSNLQRRVEFLEAALQHIEATSMDKYSQREARAALDTQHTQIRANRIAALFEGLHSSFTSPMTGASASPDLDIEHDVGDEPDEVDEETDGGTIDVNTQVHELTAQPA